MNRRGKDVSNEYKWDKASQSYIPKASPLAYTLYIRERKEVLLKENEKAEEGKKLSIKQISRKVISEWRNMSDEGKRKYLEIVETEKKRYDMQRKEIEEKGYFSLTNGTKSTELPHPNEPENKKRSATPVKPVKKKGNIKKN